MTQTASTARARAIRADTPKQMTPLDVEADVLEGAHPAEALRHVREREESALRGRARHLEHRRRGGGRCHHRSVPVGPLDTLTGRDVTQATLPEPPWRAASRRCNKRTTMTLSPVMTTVWRRI